MQQDAGLRLKCLGGRLEWGRLPISLVYREIEWLFYGAACAALVCLPGWAFCSSEEAATSAGGSRISPSTSGVSYCYEISQILDFPTAPAAFSRIPDQ